MAVIGDFTVPAESFALDAALADAPDMIVRADRLASHSTEGVLPFLWATKGDFETFREALRNDSTVKSATVAAERSGSVLYQLKWNQNFVDLINEMIDQHAAIVEADARAGSWRLKLRFTEEGEVSSFQRHFSDTGVTFEVNQLYRPDAPRQREYDLTPEQRDTLVTALDKGYFEIPRDISIEELADEFGISANAISQRIRRGSANLVRNTLTITADRERDEE
ncbi:helix-turn-helix domain-containing protein [Haladaptatus salinisoli]|uniref:helix-turn-helix domain-containing protein n=1 Tax=Haladaptatus salinisoli TaxID=2884876 RepID=UPI001D0AA420|nr:helix-turn-helix domain-containing protein [Haladaptatus salinisoli]